jgi:hypothetical protein
MGDLRVDQEQKISQGDRPICTLELAILLRQARFVEQLSSEFRRRPRY